MNFKQLLFESIKAAFNAGEKIIEIYNTNFSIEYKEDSSPLTLADKSSHEIISSNLSHFGIPILSEEGGEISFEERKNWKYLWVIDPLDGTKEFIKKNGEFTVNIALIRKGKPLLGVIYAPVLKKLYFGLEKNGSYVFDVNQQFNFNSINEILTISNKLPLKIKKNKYKVVASRSHLGPETLRYVEKLKTRHPIDFVSIGSSLKICLVAEGIADIYPRFAPTWEWDTAAGHAIINAMGGKIAKTDNKSEELIYNKENLLNPWFIVIPK